MKPTTRRVVQPTGLVVFLVILANAPAGGQGSCAGCHLELAIDEPDVHLEDWRNSPHYTAEVSCAACHGGDPSSFEAFRAHLGVKNSGQKDSPTYFKNVPATCGSCHTDLVNSYRQSAHFGLLQNGDRHVPTCTTCHGEVAARSLRPGGLRARCRSCHDPGEEYERPGMVDQARDLVARFREMAKLRARAQDALEGTEDPALEHELENALHRAEVDYLDAIVTGHRFDYEAMAQAVAASERSYEELARALGLETP